MAYQFFYYIGGNLLSILFVCVSFMFRVAIVLTPPAVARYTKIVENVSTAKKKLELAKFSSKLERAQ